VCVCGFTSLLFVILSPFNLTALRVHYIMGTPQVTDYNDLR
jgi:hypothetical protein